MCLVIFFAKLDYKDIRVGNLTFQPEVGVEEFRKF